MSPPGRALEPRDGELAAGSPQEDALLDELRSFGIQPTAFVRRPAQPPGFEVVRELSRGGQGIVYEAVQRSTGRRVALKVGLARELPGRAESERFQREVRLLASLHHSSLPTVFESGIDDGWRWLAMEFIEGVDLATWVCGSSSSPREIVSLCVRICEGVGLAHRHGIVHRDLKPSNILIDGEGKPVVLDFGLAKRVAAVNPDAPDVTGIGSIVGSPLWLAPEQIESPDEVGPRADVYALGRLLYHLLSGAHPYRGEPGKPEWLRNVRDAEPLPLARASTSASASDPILAAIVMRAIEREPARRYPDADALRADCEAWLAGRETVARPSGPLTRARRAARRHPRRSAAALVAAAALAAVAGGWLLSAPTRWEEAVQEALQLPPSDSLPKLWGLHLGAPRGIDRPTAPPTPTSLSGPSATHYALLARYLAEPCLGRVRLPGAEGSRRVLLSAPLSDAVVIQFRGEERLASELWLGREPEYDWVRLQGLEPSVGWELSSDGRLLAGRGYGPEWRLWDLDSARRDAPPRELAWAAQRGACLLALGWSDAGTGEAVGLTREADSELSLVRLADGTELARLPGLSAELPPSAPVTNLALSPGGRWLAVSVPKLDPWLVAMANPSAPPRRLQHLRPRSLEFVDPSTLSVDLMFVETTSEAIDSGGFRLLDVERQDDSLGRLLFATNDRPRPPWLREHALVARSTTSSIQVYNPASSEPVTRWPTPATILGQASLEGRQLLVTEDSDDHLSRWDVSQESGGTIIPPWHRLIPEKQGGRDDGSVFGIAFSPSGDQVAVSILNPPRVRIQTLRGSGEDRDLHLPEGDAPNCLAWSPAGDGRVAIGGLSGRIYLWSPEPADGAIAEATDAEHTARSAPSPALVFYGELGGTAHGITFSPEGRELYVGGRASGELPPGRIRVWRVGEPGTPIRTLDDVSLPRVTSLAFQGGSAKLVVGLEYTDRLQWLDRELEGDLAPPSVPPAHPKRVTRDLRVHGSDVFSGHRDGTLRHRAWGGDVDAELDLGSECFTLAVHPDGELIAAGAADGRIHLLSLLNGSFAPIVSIPFPALRGPAGTRRIFSARFSPDGRYLVVGGEPGTVPCYLDLGEAERCLAGNVDWALSRREGDLRGAEYARAWAESRLAPGPAAR